MREGSLPQPPYRPSQWRATRAAPAPASATDLKTLADAANEAAKREAAQWFYFVTIMITLAAIVGSTTHRVLFLEEPVKVPILSVELPLRGFYVAGPALFLVLHFYLLAQVRLMAGKVRAFLDAVDRETAGDATARELALHWLDTFSVAQLVAADRQGRWALAVRAMVWVTLVAAPVLLLLFFQLRFLPFHSEGITWWHRALLAVDLGLMWALWPSLESGWRARAAIHAGRGIGAAVMLDFAVFLATIPGEASDVGGRWLRLRAALFGDLSADDIGVDQQSRTLFSLPDQDFVPEDETVRAAMQRTRVLRGRHLEYAVLDRADLRKADLTGAFLQGATLIGAQMQGASLNEAQMQGASLNEAQMQGATLIGAQMQGASLEEAQMQGASLEEAQMQGASLDSAQMQGALLNRVQMQSASLNEAQMQGATLYGAQMQGASLNWAQVWRVRAVRSETEDSLFFNLRSGADPPCTDRTDQAGACPRDRAWADWVDTWLALIPDQRRKDRARDWLAVLLQLLPDPPELAGTAAAWRAVLSVDPTRVTQRLGDLACDAAGAPYLARAILRQIRWAPPSGRALGPHRATLAARIAGEACPGARGLTDEERARLAAIAAGRD